MNPSKLNQLIREAAFDDMARNSAMEYGKQRAKRMAGEFGRNKIPDSIIEEAAYRGHRSELDPLARLQRDVEIAKALSEGNLKELINLYDQIDSLQARAAIEQMVVESGDINKLYSLNKASRNRFMEGDIKKKKEYNERKRNFAEKLQKDIDDKFTNKSDSWDPQSVGGITDEAVAEMQGMSGVQGDMMGNDIRDALITDRIKNKQTFLGDIDMLFNNPNVSAEDIASHPRYKEWIMDEQKKLEKKSKRSSAKDIDLMFENPENKAAYLKQKGDIDQRRKLREKNNKGLSPLYKSKYAEQEELLEEASRLDDEIKELLSINDEYSADQLLRQRNRLIDRAWSMEDRTDDVDYLFKETPREEEFHKPFFDPTAKTGGKENDPKRLAKRRKELIEEASRTNKRDTVNFRKAGKKPVKRSKLDVLGERYKNTKSRANEEPSKIPTERGKTKGAMEQKATEDFIKRAARQRGFGIGSRSSTMERLLRMTRQQVIDYLDNIQDPYVKPNK